MPRSVQVEFRILGRLEVADGERDLTPPRPKQRALLALLLLRAGELVTADEAAEALWEGNPPPAARNAIQGHVAALRKLLGRERIATRDGAYLLELGEGELDLHRFERLLGEARGREPEEQAELVDAALGLFRGTPLEDFRYDGFAVADAARIDELRLHALETRIDVQLQLGRHEGVVPELETLVREAPLRERLWGQLVVALYRSGRQADALAAHRRARETLDELGLEPGPDLQRLERRVLQQDPELDFLPPGTLVRLPSPPTPLLGRRRELEQVGAVLRGGHRIVTLVGPGGSGKTRLAIEAARRSGAIFRGGTVFVGLAPLADPDLVLPTVAHAIGASEGASSLGEAIAARADRPTLVVLDNVEHLAAAAPALGTLLSTTPALTILATSREPLRLYGEHLYRVEPLDEDAAAELFVSRAEAVGTRAPEPGVVREICRRLDRLPLAIELAAAQTDVLPPAALLDRLTVPHELLTQGAVDHHPRQQTLRQTLEWSHERLTAKEQRLFARLAVFAGGWTVDAAHAVCGEGLDVVSGLSSLLDKSLTRIDADDGAPRQAMLETIRAYAREQLAAGGELDAVASNHVGFFLDLAESAEAHLRGTPGEWLGRLELEHPNLRAALDAAAPDEELRLAGALWRFWYLRGHLTEGRRRLERVLETAPPESPRAKALIGAAVMAANTGDGDRGRARAAEARTLCRELGDAAGEAYAAFMLGNFGADAESARRDYEFAIAAFRRLGDEHSALLASRHLAMTLAGAGDEAAARALHEQNLAGARVTGNGRIVASSLGALAELELRAGHRARAAGLLRESLAIHQDLGDVLDTGVDLCRYAATVVAEDAQRAATLVGAFEALGDAVGGRRAWVAELNVETLATARAHLGEDGLEAAFDSGRELSLDDAIELALVG